MNSILRSIPPIHTLQNDSRFIDIKESYSVEESNLTKFLQEIVSELRGNLVDKSIQFNDESEINHWIFSQLKNKVQDVFKPSLRRVINATGTVLHTNLGRAKLSEEAAKKAIDIAVNYSNLEYNLEEGKRGSRHDHVEEIITKITGAESAMVVNNNAAAVYLVLRALAENKEVIVSRGELVEIGGSFRVSSIMEESGAKLVEIGTTNRTHLRDYEQATTEETKMFMKVHTSNFRIEGFTASVSSDQLVQLKEKHPNVLVYEDLGSGVLFDFSEYGIGDEPVVQKVIDSGVDLVSFSGDKLLGGPQAGIIAGKKELIQKLKNHQLARVLRVDKMTLAALEATLLEYTRGIESIKNIPTVEMIIEDKNVILERIQEFISILNEKDHEIEYRIEENDSQVGGGTMPDVRIPTYVLVWKHLNKKSVQCMNEMLTLETPIIARIAQDEIMFDFRTIRDKEIKLLAQLLQSL